MTNTPTAGAAELPEALALRLATRIEQSGQFTNLWELDEAAACLRRLAAQVEALSAAQAGAPAGYVLVPLEPTIAMCIAGDTARWNTDDSTRSAPVYRAMLAAAPQPSPSPAPAGRECCNEHCGWIGSEADCVHPKHEASYRLCPKCYEVTEAVSLPPAPAQPGQEGELAETTDEDLMTIAVVGLNSARFRLAKGDCAGALEVVNKAREACIVAGERASARAARAAPQPATDYDHGPQATTIEEAARDVGKWLNERPSRPLDLRHVAMLAHYAQAPQPATADAVDAVDAARWRWLSEHISVAWDEGKFTSLVRIVSEKNRDAINAAIDRMMTGDWSDATATPTSKRGGA